MINLPKEIVVNGLKIKLDYKLTCTDKNIVYIIICKYCENGFYFGQTQTKFHVRMNGHRNSFNVTKYSQSALANHIYHDHIEYFDDKLKCYNFGIIKKVSPYRLDRLEDFYIWSTDADTIGLNRYKVSSD